MKYIYVLFLLCGLVFIASGVGKICSYILFFSKAIVVPGKIVRYEETAGTVDDSGRHVSMYKAVVAYTFAGETREVSPSISSSSPDQGNLGKILKVGINPKDSNDVRVESVWQMVLLSIAFIIGGGIFLVFACVCCPYSSEILASISTPFHVAAPQTFAFSHPTLVRWLARGIVVAFALVIFGIPLSMMGGGSWLLYRHITFFKKAIMVTGTIVDYNARTAYDRDSDGRRRNTTMYTPVISYSYDGEKYEIISHWSSSSRSKNETCQVGVNPDNPSDARAYYKADLVVAIVLICAGVLVWLAVLKIFL